MQPNLFRTLSSLSISTVLTVGLTMASGCATGSPPEFTDDPLVSCAIDGSGAFVWEFSALVDDPDGYENVSDVTVDTYNESIDPENSLETFYLDYESNGAWYLAVPETDSAYLDCANPTGFEFDFYAVDLDGNESEGVTFAF